MDNTLVFVDDGFLSKLSKFFGKGNYVKFHRKDFAEFLCKNEKLNCEKIFIYTAPPFQSRNLNKSETKRKEGYDKFVNKLKKNKIIVREGRCQRLKLDGEFIYRQKAVDILLSIDLMSVNMDFPNVKKIILVSSDSDFVPVINKLKKQGIKTILYTYYDKKRNSNFSRCNDLVKSVSKYVLIERGDVDKND